jgi:hypothetical protein
LGISPEVQQANRSQKKRLLKFAAIIKLSLAHPDRSIRIEMAQPLPQEQEPT